MAVIAPPLASFTRDTMYFYCGAMTAPYSLNVAGNFEDGFIFIS
jgi:hypothetical protein